MATDRVEYTDLTLSFPYDDGRGITTAVATALCLDLTKQAFSVLFGYGHYSTGEVAIIDSAECHAIIKAAAIRILEEWYSHIHRRTPMPLMILLPEEKAEILLLNRFSYYSVEDDDTLQLT